MDKSQWPALKERLVEVFKGKTRDEWCAIMEHTDVCFAPVLTMAEAAEHPHNIARNMIIERNGLKQPAPAPRFSRTVPEVTRDGQHPGQGSREILEDWGIAKDRIDELVESGAVAAARAFRSGSWSHRNQDPDENDPPIGSAGPWSTLVFVHAHPDDEASSTGGSMARAAAEGHRVVLVVCTDGDLGEAPDDLADGETVVDRRRKETAASTAILGVARTVWLGYQRLAG